MGNKKWFDFHNCKRTGHAMRWHGGRGAWTSGCYLRFPIPVSLHGNVALPLVDDLHLNRHSRGQLVVIIKLDELRTIAVGNSTKNPLIKVCLNVPRYLCSCQYNFDILRWTSSKLLMIFHPASATVRLYVPNYLDTSKKV